MMLGEGHDSLSLTGTSFGQADFLREAAMSSVHESLGLLSAGSSTVWVASSCLSGG
jgi:hypothetical protein